MAIILLSGGLDSTTVLAYAKSKGAKLNALSFDYGQKNRFEFVAAKAIAEKYEIESHHISKIDLKQIGGSSLTSNLDVEKNRNLELIGNDIPKTYVPARNTIFLSYALAWCEVLNCTDIFIGANQLDYSGYPDCRPDYFKAFEKMANLATKIGTEGTGKIKIHTPLINLNKKQIIELGIKLGIDYSQTISCYDPKESGETCKECDACILRAKGFKEAGIKDPAIKTTI